MGSYAIRVQGGDRRFPTTAANALATNAVVTTSPAKLYTINGYSSGTYILLFDLTAVPANGTTAFMTIPVNSGQFYYDVQDGIPFYTGVVAVASTTATTLTIDAANTQFAATYRSL